MTITERILNLPFAGLLMQLALSNTVLATILIYAMYEQPVRTVVVR